jgi:hypothetical protein
MIRRIQSLLHLSENTTGYLEKLFSGEKSAEDEFGMWYRSPENGWVRSMVSLLIVLSAFNLVYFLRKAIPGIDRVRWLNITDIAQVVDWVEMLVIIFVALQIVLKTKINAPGDTPPMRAASNATKRFLSFWPLLWLSWFALYLFLAVSSAGIELLPKLIMPAFLNLVNNLSGVLLFSMYYEMAFKTEPAGNSNAPTRLWIPATMILFVLWALELVATHIISSDMVGRVAVGFSLFSGIAVGITAGLLVTRLASKSLGVPFWAISFLTMYAVIQPVFPLISRPNDDVDRHLSQIFVMVAFYGKILLLAVIHWLRDSNRLWYYMVEAAERHQQEEEVKFGQFVRRFVRFSDPEDM